MPSIPTDIPASFVDNKPPTVTFVTQVGTRVTKDSPISFDAIDENLSAVTVSVAYNNGAASETIYSSGAFTRQFITGSVRTIIRNGYSFTVVRTDGWPGSPTITVTAVDAGNN